MENKVLVKLTIVDIDESFDLYLPVNEVFWKIRQLITKAVSDLMGMSLQGEFALINKDTCRMYGNNEILIDTDIRNGSELIMVSLRKNTTANVTLQGEANNPFRSQIPKKVKPITINDKIGPNTLDQ